MKKFFIILTGFLFMALSSKQQVPADSIRQERDTSIRVSAEDSLRKVTADSLAGAVKDSIARALEEQHIERRIQNFQVLLRQHPNFPFQQRPVPSNIFQRDDTGQEPLFYFLIGLLFYFACIKLVFGKYLDNLITLFFRVTMRQQQIREQLLQTPLASLLLNILFVLSSGMYLALLARYYSAHFFQGIWTTFLYAMAFISAVYLGKFIVLKITGWIFNIQSATDIYIFIVFLVNKMIGIFLLPFIVFMAFPNRYLLPVLVLLSYVMLVMLFGYRFFNSFRPIRNEIKVTRFQFFIYLCAFEIAPLLLIYKVLLAFVERSD